MPWLGWSTLLIIVIFSSNFLYQYFYKTVAEAQDIYIIRAKVSLQAVDVKLYESILTSLIEKKRFDSNQIEHIKDPFTNQATIINTLEVPTTKPQP